MRGMTFGALITAGILAASGAQAACSGDNAGISLPPGFCATVFADHLGHPRHLVVAPDGVVYANTWSGRYFHNDTPPPGGMLVAMKGSGDKADQVVRFGPGLPDDHGGTGIALYKGYVYAEMNDKIVRYKLPSDGIAPTGEAEEVVSGMPITGDHPMHPLAIDSKGEMFVDMGSATNSCQPENRVPDIAGASPCVEKETRGGTWRFDAEKLNQAFSPAQRFASGLRNGEGISFDSDGRVYATQHGRDQLYENWSKYYPSQILGAENPAEELVMEHQGSDFGWPECYYDYKQKKLVLAPEYGGDGGHKVGVCASRQEPVAAFPAHWAPNDMQIYLGSAFPSAYDGGAFIAFHGSWNRAPLPQGGYNVVFQPLKDGKASGHFVVFADGFAAGHKEPGRAAHRPTGIAFAPDGAMYIADDQGGRIYRVTYSGAKTVAVAAAPAPVVTASASGTGVPPEGMNPDAGLPVPPGGSPDQVSAGGAVYRRGACAGCHGSDGKGSAIGADLTSGHYLWGDGSVASIQKTIQHGVAKPKEHTGAMPAEGGIKLSQADLVDVSEYVWAIGHRK